MGRHWVAATLTCSNGGPCGATFTSGGEMPLTLTRLDSCCRAKNCISSSERGRATSVGSTNVASSLLGVQALG